MYKKNNRVAFLLKKNQTESIKHEIKAWHYLKSVSIVNADGIKFEDNDELSLIIVFGEPKKYSLTEHSTGSGKNGDVADIHRQIPNFNNSARIIEFKINSDKEFEVTLSFDEEPLPKEKVMQELSGNWVYTKHQANDPFRQDIRFFSDGKYASDTKENGTYQVEYSSKGDFTITLDNRPEHTRLIRFINNNQLCFMGKEYDMMDYNKSE